MLGLSVGNGIKICHNLMEVIKYLDINYVYSGSDGKYSFSSSIQTPHKSDLFLKSNL